MVQESRVVVSVEPAPEMLRTGFLVDEDTLGEFFVPRVQLHRILRSH